MQDTSQQLPALDEYVDMPALLPLVAHAFPSQPSLKWFIRLHRDALVDAGAMICLTGRLRFHPGRFQQTVVEICHRLAKKSA